MSRSPVQARSQARVERILSAAATMLAEVDGEVTVRALAARADVAPGTIYQFFPDMAAVGAAVNARARELLVETLATEVPFPLATEPQRFFEALIRTVDRLQRARPEFGCVVRPHLRSEYAQALARDLRDEVEAHVRKALLAVPLREGTLPLERRLDLACATLLAVLARAPRQNAADREAYLAFAAHLAGTALQGSRLADGADFGSLVNAEASVDRKRSVEMP